MNLPTRCNPCQQCIDIGPPFCPWNNGGGGTAAVGCCIRRLSAGCHHCIEPVALAVNCRKAHGLLFASSSSTFQTISATPLPSHRISTHHICPCDLYLPPHCRLPFLVTMFYRNSIGMNLPTRCNPCERCDIGPPLCPETMAEAEPQSSSCATYCDAIILHITAYHS